MEKVKQLAKLPSQKSMSKSRGTSTPVKGGIERKMKRQKKGGEGAGAPPMCLLMTSKKVSTDAELH